MALSKPFLPNRRTLLAGGAAMFANSAALRAFAAGPKTFDLVAAPARTPIVGGAHSETNVWAYNGTVPGPEIRVRQGERLRISVQNKLPESTTVHCHGIRLPNAMDGVPDLTQKPIEPGETFVYEFDCPDAGTFWYHPHVNSAAQVGRGLYGALIVEERKPPTVDREVVWVLDDWRLRDDGSIHPDFRNFHDIAHAGRLGNTVTVNGRVTDSFSVRSGERIRLRLINAANARIFGLNFQEHSPLVVAVDGQPVEPHAADEGLIVLAPGMRMDLLLDLTGKPGQRYMVRDDYYSRASYAFLELAYAERALRDSVLDGGTRLAPNPLAEPDLDKAERLQVVLGGGMMGRMMTAIVDGREMDVRSMFRSGVAWAMNGIAATGHLHDPLLTFTRDRSYVIELINDTAWPHPMHLHGHSLRVISRNGRAEPLRLWQDTVLIPGREWAEIALVADNPGDWMFHCHILEHQIAGMMGVVRVA
jgi:FtsP/CotA-like multicopper oxidase with cupredoxin domain